MYQQLTEISPEKLVAICKEIAKNLNELRVNTSQNRNESSSNNI